jgi:hypothetical protein
MSQIDNAQYVAFFVCCLACTTVACRHRRDDLREERSPSAWSEEAWSETMPHGTQDLGVPTGFRALILTPFGSTRGRVPGGGVRGRRPEAGREAVSRPRRAG